MTTADLVVLSLLEEEAMHGHGLLAEYQRQEVVDWASISKAQLYYALNKLRDRGLIEEVADQEATRDRTVYRPTDAGREALSQGLTEPAWAQGRVPQPFATWLGLSIHAPAETRADMQRARLAYLNEEIIKERQSLDYVSTLTEARAVPGKRIVELMIRQLEVERDWVEELLAEQ